MIKYQPMLFTFYLSFLVYGQTHGSLSDDLWKATSDLQQAALTSSFIKGLANADLDPTAFGGYIVRDSFFCYIVKLSYDFAMNRTADENLRQFMVQESKGFDDEYHKDLTDFYIDNPTGITAGEACTGYVNHIHNVTVTMNPYYLVVTMIPCAKLWPWIGIQINSTTGNFGVYDKWVKENLDSANHKYLRHEKIINDAFNAGKIDRSTALFAFRQSMIGEVAFFNEI